jgi:hypothetical protein
MTILRSYRRLLPSLLVRQARSFDRRGLLAVADEMIE